MTTQRAEYPRQHTAELPWQHIVTQIFQMTYCQAVNTFSLWKWPTAIKQNKQASCERPFSHEKKHPRGGLWRHKHQTPIKHTSTDANKLKIFSLKLFTFMDSGVLFFPCTFLPISLLLSVLFLCCFCVVSFSLFALAHSDAFNASRVMQVWLSVSVDRQPTLKRCKCPALWSEHGKLEMSLLVPTFKTNWQQVKTKHGCVDALFSLVVGMQGRKQGSKDWRGRMSWGWSQEVGG